MRRQEEISINEFLSAEEELAALKSTCSPCKDNRLWVRIGDWLVAKSRGPVKVKRKKYLLLAATCGWLCGAHRFYSKNRFWGICYLLFFWTGFSAAMTIVDILLALRAVQDENGFIEL